MPNRKRQPPSYRQRKGYNQAIVTLTVSVTGVAKSTGAPNGLGSNLVPQQPPLIPSEAPLIDRSRSFRAGER